MTGRYAWTTDSKTKTVVELNCPNSSWMELEASCASRNEAADYLDRRATLLEMDFLETVNICSSASSTCLLETKLVQIPSNFPCWWVWISSSILEGYLNVPLHLQACVFWINQLWLELWLVSIMLCWAESAWLRCAGSHSADRFWPLLGFDFIDVVLLVIPLLMWLLREGGCSKDYCCDHCWS